MDHKPECRAPLIELTESGTAQSPLQRDAANTRIETVLVEVNSSSGKFQVRVLLLFCLYTFAMGMHAYTFLFMFISPRFFYSDARGKGTRFV